MLFGRGVSSIHCVGVAGMGVGPLAIYLVRRGFAVSGEDDAMTDVMRVQLERAGVRIMATGDLPADCGLVAYSSAIVPTHPAVVAARGRGLPMVRRGELLAEVTQDQKLVAVCGSHGKTTTSAMLATALVRAGFPTGYVLGGLIGDDAFPPAAAGSNGWVIAEIDESDGTISRFSPEITLAVNLDWDHPDHYRQLSDLEAVFAALFARTRGTVLVNATCALSHRIAAQVSGGTSVATFGPGGDYAGAVVKEDATGLHLTLGGKFAIGRAEVCAWGEFNAANATAALAAAQCMGATLCPDLLAGYAGVRRRQSLLHADEAITVVEDYAHHPAEIRALLISLRRRVSPGGRLVVVFQPHRFSRTRQFLGDFAEVLTMADSVHLLDVYGAGEAPMAGGTTGDLVEAVRRLAPEKVLSYEAAKANAVLAALEADVRAGDLVAVVGAGDIDQAARHWLARRKQTLMKTMDWDGLAEAWRGAVSAATKVKREESLAEKTTMRVGGAARIYAEPANLPDLQALLRAAAQAGVPVHVLGRGSNLLVPDSGVDGLVLSLRQATWESFEPLPDGRVRVGAGLRLKNLCGLATKAGLVGFEFLEGIPGNVGGALRMNAGAMGGWMFDVVTEVTLVTYAGEVKMLRKEEMHVDYRHCAELHDAIALGAILRPVAEAEADTINRQIDAYRAKRQKSQPREPSAGCIFKNPPGDSAGRLIDQSGLKGERVGDAEVSSVHANFIVNRGHATSADVIALVRKIRARVEQAKGVKLEPEVLLYGQRWEDVL
ncbi:hypothetical protein MASR2M8_04470 [Opitutaceae bacterium]